MGRTCLGKIKEINAITSSILSEKRGFLTSYYVINSKNHTVRKRTTQKC
jgi:hypothetical protein